MTVYASSSLFLVFGPYPKIIAIIQSYSSIHEHIALTAVGNTEWGWGPFYDLFSMAVLM